MKLNKQISELVQTDFVPVEETKEGLLRGGFGEILAEKDSTRVRNNCACNGNNCDCPNGKCEVSGDNCNCGTTTTTTTVIVTGIQFEF